MPCPSCLQAVINVGPGYWAVVILTGVSTGFDGALSTVSTFVNEVRMYYCRCILLLISFNMCRCSGACPWVSL